MAPSPLIPASRLFRFACHEDVTQMPERATGHHCESCRKTVVDMSRLTPEEAIETVRTAPPATCVSYAFSADGSLLFRSGRRLGGTVAVALTAFLAACNPAVSEPERASDVEQLELDQVPLAQRPEEARPGESTVTPTSAPDYPAATPPAWPAATETTLAAGAPVPPPAPPPSKKPVPPQIHHTAGKPVMPVQHLAGALPPGRGKSEL